MSVINLVLSIQRNRLRIKLDSRVDNLTDLSVNLNGSIYFTLSFNTTSVAWANFKLSHHLLNCRVKTTCGAVVFRAIIIQHKNARLYNIK